MSELNGPNFSVNKVNFQGVQKQPQEVTVQESSGTDAPKIKDFSNPTEVLGRSQVKKADNSNSDLKMLLENPQIAENSDKIFEAAYAAAKAAGAEHPYEEASEFATGKV